MKQIRTIKNRLDNSFDFDKEVNRALEEGWRLTRREVLRPNAHPDGETSYTMLYAELEKEIITEAERCCENCKHFEREPDEEPCHSCEDLDKWEEPKP